MPKHTRTRPAPCFGCGGEGSSLGADPDLAPTRPHSPRQLPAPLGTSQLPFLLRDGAAAELNLGRASPLAITSHLISFGKDSEAVGHG